MPWRFPLNPVIVPIVLISFTLFTVPCSVPAANESPDARVDIIFYSNLNGNVENCRCGDPPLGGLSRIVSLVREIREEKPQALFVDGGDFLNTYPYPELNHCIIRSYGYFSPDIIVPGDQEFISGVSYAREFLGNWKERVLLTNAETSLMAQRQEIRLPVNAEMQVRFLSYLDADAFYYTNAEEAVPLSSALFDKTYKTLNESDLNILIFHGTEKRLYEFRKQYSAFSLILHAHEQSSVIEDSNPPFVVGGGADGEFLNYIRLSRQKNALRIAVEQLPVRLDIAPDTVIEGFIEAYKAAERR